MPAVTLFSAPGRVNLLGEHTDYSGGLVLPAAIDRTIRLDATPERDFVRLTSAEEPGVVVVEAATGAWWGPPWGRYVGAVVVELAELGRPPVGLVGRLEGNLPVGAGLSSSAALEVCIATALCAHAAFELEPIALALACQRAEHRAVGVPSGVMDQAASLLGRAGHAILLDCRTLAHRLVPLPEGIALLVVDSGVRRKLEHAPYALRRAELERGIAALGRRNPADVEPEELDGLLENTGLDEIAAKRLRHVVAENARVRAAEWALRAGDRAALGRLFAEGHESLRDLFEVSIPELDLLVELARDEGAFAARLTGGGFGGAIIALAESDRAAAIGEAVTRRYHERLPERDATPHLCRAVDGARAVPG
jgi:galactokinase